MLRQGLDSASKTAKGRLNRHFICRAAGLPVAQLDELRAPLAVAAHDDCARIQEGLDGLSAELSDQLFTAVDGEQDQGLRRALLNLKRDAHNGRRLRAKDLTMVDGRIDTAVLKRLHQYRDGWLELQDARRAARDIYDQEIVHARKRFQQAVGHEDFAKGLLLSSLSLSDNVRRYQRASPEKTGAKARQIERSLMRYFSRTVMKATPFSTFCSLLPGRLDRKAQDATFDLDPADKAGHIRLNKTLYALMLPYLLGRPGIRSRLDVELNPTLQPEGQGLLFLAARGQQEIFQRMGPNPVVELLRERFHDHSRLPWQDLVDTLCQHPEVEASPEQAAAYVDKMIDIGLLRFRVGIPEQEADWDRPLVGRLSPIDDDVARRVVIFLRELRQIADAYGQAEAGSRRAPLTRARSLVQELFQEIAPGRTEVKAPPFYEDAGAGGEEPGTALRLDLGDLEQALLDYVRLTSRLSWPRTEQANMRHFFDSFYGPEPTSLPLLKFYEDYYREHFKEHLRHQHGGPEGAGGVDQDEGEGEGEDERAYSVFNPFGLQFLEDLDQGHKNITRRIQELWAEGPEAEELKLSKGDFESAVDPVPPLEAEPFSVSLFTQYLADYRADGAPALVARSYLTGFGKYFSRFLYLLPDEVQQDLYADNRSMSEKELAEICGDANFNANLHPPLLPKELSYPTGEAGQEEHQILSSDVWVERDPASPFRLRLKRKSSGKTVVPVDLGFLNPRMRPHLFQLLSRFTPGLSFNLPIPETPTAMRDPELGDQIRYRPRITYEGKLILARRQWQLSEAQFPELRAQESAADYFFRVQTWRREVGLPQEVFMRIDVRPAPADTQANPGSSEEKSTGEKTTEKKTKASSPIRQHLYKPQYIDFHNPLLVDLFSRTSETLDYFQCTFEERLPGHGHLVAHEADRFATEMIFQVDFPNGTAETGSSGSDAHEP